MFFIIEKSEETTFEFLQRILTQRIINLLTDSDNELLKFATKRWYVIHDQNGKDYGAGNENSTSIK